MTILSDMVKLKKAENGHFLVFSEKKKIIKPRKSSNLCKKTWGIQPLCFQSPKWFPLETAPKKHPKRPFLGIFGVFLGKNWYFKGDQQSKFTVGDAS